MDGPGEFERQIADLSEHLLSEEPLEVSLVRVANLAVTFLPSCDACGVSTVVEGRVATRVASDEMAQRVDSYQYAIDEGPCVDAVRTGRPFRVDSLADERRWPRFAPRALQEGVVSSYSVPLKAVGRTVGALNLYSRSMPFHDADEAIAATFVSQAAVALANAQTYQRMRDLIDQLNEALASRDVIGQAKGILMGRGGCSAEEAFDMLRVVSQDRNQKLHHVARSVVDSAAKKTTPP